MNLGEATSFKEYMIGLVGEDLEETFLDIILKKYGVYPQIICSLIGLQKEN